MPRMNRKPGEKAKDFKGTLKKLIKYAGRYRIGIIAVMICAIASATFSIVSPKILGKATTKLAEGLMSKISGTRGRKKQLADIAKEYHADGIIVESNKFCEYWSYERTINTIVLKRDFGIPVCSIEKEYINSASGQLRTRFQAFIESIEIKKIQEGK